MNIWIEKVHSEFCLSNFEFLWVKETNKSIPLRSIRDSLPKNYSSAIDLNSKCIKCDENFHQFLLFIEYLSYIHPYHIVYELHFYNTKTILLEILSGASYHENDFIKYEHFVRVYSRKIKKNSLLFMNLNTILWAIPGRPVKCSLLSGKFYELLFTLLTLTYTLSMIHSTIWLTICYQVSFEIKVQKFHCRFHFINNFLQLN